MEQNAHQLSEWLKKNLKATLAIEKQESDDLDKVYFTAESVEFRSADDVVDDYLDNAFILRGNGNTRNAEGELVPLPQPAYEIAVSGLQIEKSSPEQIVISTDRAKYTLSLS